LNQGHIALESGILFSSEQPFSWCGVVVSATITAPHRSHFVNVKLRMARLLRPGLGLPTKYLEQVLGKTVKQDVKRGTGLG